MKSCSGKGLLLIIWGSHVISILLFLRGFFPIKSFLPEFSSREDLVVEPGMELSIKSNENSELYTALIGRTVIIIIDALRIDFVFDKTHASSMPFLQKLLANGEGQGYVAKAHPPTVTLPRIKALTTGTIPGYIDVLLNFDSPQLVEDNLIDQAVLCGSKLVFYGDETWIKLFPHHFLRSEGTTSFFVTDFVEVDSNVTRHLDLEMQKTDWDILILHYLGLDHIGHVTGPQSLHIGPKLREMDDNIKLLYSALYQEDFLEINSKPSMVVICGDHGMSDAGSHGGASAAEIYVPVMFLSPLLKSIPKVKHQEILQIDLVPSLAALLGFPIPKNNVGRLISPIFDFLNWRRKLYLALVNTRQLMLVAQQYITEKSDANIAEYYFTIENHKEWLRGNCTNQSALSNCGNSNEIFANYSRMMDAFSKIVESKSTNYNISIMLLAVLIHWLNLICLAVSVIKHPALSEPCTFLSIFLWSALIGHAASLASSSFVEEEHQTWYCLSTTAFVMLLFKSGRKSPMQMARMKVRMEILGIIALIRICRIWNSTGDKWAHLPDIGDWLNDSNNQLWLSASCACSLVLIIALHGRQQDRPKKTLLAIIGILIYIYRANAGFLFIPDILLLSTLSYSSIAKLIYSLIAVFLLSNCLTRNNSTEWLISGFQTSWTLLVVLLLRSHNSVLIALIALQQELFTKVVAEVKLSVVDSTLLTLSLAQCSFFQQGNSNSLAHIDLAGGYVGLNAYNPALVGILLMCSTYAGLVSWLLNLCSILYCKDPYRFKESLMLSSFVLLLCRTLPWASYCLIAFLQRYHLFVWSVFSPKLLYEGVLSGVFLVVILYFGFITTLMKR